MEYKTKNAHIAQLLDLSWSTVLVSARNIKPRDQLKIAVEVEVENLLHKGIKRV